jgi:crossover junction endodeoxyribonuclease RuvC
MKPGRKGGYQTSASRLLKQLDGLPIKKAYIELVHSRPGNSGKSSFSFGCNYCALFGVFAALDIPMEFITPKVWKTTFDLINKEKDESRKKALQLFPHLHLSLFRVVDCDKADAIFIGLAGKKRGKK